MASPDACSTLWAQNRLPLHRGDVVMDGSGRDAADRIHSGQHQRHSGERAKRTQRTLLFSATMSPEIARISKKYLHNAKEITIGRKNEGTNNVKHVVFTVHAKDKYAALKRIVDYYPQIYGIIFCNAVPVRKHRKSPTN